MKPWRSFLLFVGLFVLSAVLIYKGLPENIPVPQDVLSEIIEPSPSQAVSPVVVGAEQSATPSASLPANSIQVTKVVDGDTIEVSIHGQKQSVRFIGIDTPETVDPRRPVMCFGREASNETKRLLAGKTVQLRKDVSETDKYGRLLRYVYLPLADGNLLFINDHLVRQGFAQASDYPPDVSMSQQLRQAEREAREHKRGLWGECR